MTEIKTIKISDTDIDVISEQIFEYIDNHIEDPENITWEDNSFDYEYGSISATHDPGATPLYEGNEGIHIKFELPESLSTDDIEYITDTALIDDIHTVEIDDTYLSIEIITWIVTGNIFEIQLGWEITDAVSHTANSLRKKANDERRLEEYLDRQ